MNIKYISIVILFVVILAIAYFYLIPTLPHNLHLSANCKIYNLEGKILRELKGSDCTYFNDGSWVSLGPEGKINFFNKENKLKSSLEEPGFCCILTKVENDNIILVSNEVINYLGYEKVKFDEVIKIDKSGNIISRLRLRDHVEYLKSKLDLKGRVKPFKIKWKSNLDFEFVSTHISSISKNEMDIVIENKIVAPKGSYTLFSNIGYKGIIIIDSDLKNVLYARPLAVTMAHDVHFTGPNKILFFENSTRLINKKYPKRQLKEIGVWAKLVEVDLDQKKRLLTINSGFFGEVGGGGRKITDGLYIIFDTKPIDELKELTLTDKLIFSSRKRVNIFSPLHGVFKIFEIENATETPRLFELEDFLKNNLVTVPIKI